MDDILKVVIVSIIAIIAKYIENKYISDTRKRKNPFEKIPNNSIRNCINDFQEVESYNSSRLYKLNSPSQRMVILSLNIYKILSISLFLLWLVFIFLPVATIEDTLQKVIGFFGEIVFSHNHISSPNIYRDLYTYIMLFLASAMAYIETIIIQFDGHKTYQESYSLLKEIQSVDEKCRHCKRKCHNLVENFDELYLKIKKNMFLTRIGLFFADVTFLDFLIIIMIDGVFTHLSTPSFEKYSNKIFIITILVVSVLIVLRYIVYSSRQEYIKTVQKLINEKYRKKFPEVMLCTNNGQIIKGKIETVFTDDIIVLNDGERTLNIKWSSIDILQIENRYVDVDSIIATVEHPTIRVSKKNCS